jgi:hypothetical protein
MVFFLGRVEVEDLSALSRTGIDRAQMFASFHLPDRSDHAIFFDSLIGYFFGFRRGRRALIFRWYRLGLRHRNFGLLLLGFAGFSRRILAQRQSGCLADGRQLQSNFRFLSVPQEILERSGLNIYSQLIKSIGPEEAQSGAENSRFATHRATHGAYLASFRATLWFVSTRRLQSRNNDTNPNLVFRRRFWDRATASARHCQC